MAIIAPFDAATLSLTGWWRANYVDGATWDGTASAGASGGQTLTVSADVAAGAVTGGYTPASFNAAGNSVLTTPVGITSLVSATASSGWFLIRTSSVIDSGGGSGYQDGNLLSAGSGANIAIGHVRVAGTPKLIANFYDGDYHRAAVAMSIDAWHLAQWRHNGVNLEVRVDGGAWSSVACGTVSFSSGAVQIGQSTYFGIVEYTGLMLEVAVTNSVLSDADFDNVRAYCIARYGVTV